MYEPRVTSFDLDPTHSYYVLDRMFKGALMNRGLRGQQSNFTQQPGKRVIDKHKQGLM